MEAHPSGLLHCAWVGLGVSRDTGSLDPSSPAVMGWGARRVPTPNCYCPQPCLGSGPAPAPAANPGDTGSCGRGGAARQLASISWGAGSAQCH